MTPHAFAPSANGYSCTTCGHTRRRHCEYYEPAGLAEALRLIADARAAHQAAREARANAPCTCAECLKFRTADASELASLNAQPLESLAADIAQASARATIEPPPFALTAPVSKAADALPGLLF